MTSGLARVLFESDSVVVGQFRCTADHPAFLEESRAWFWPNIAFPCGPIGIRFAGDEEVVGDTNTALLFNVDRPYRRRAVDGLGSRTDWVEIHPQLLGEILFDSRDAMDPEPFRGVTAPCSSGVFLRQRLAHLLAASRDEHRKDDLFLEEQVVALAADVLTAEPGRRTPTGTTDRIRDEMVQAVKWRLGQCTCESVSLSALSAAVGWSRYHMCRVFRAQTGSSIHGYLIQLRLRHGITLLADTDQRLLDIALSLGFSSDSHFSDTFFAVFGVRPSAFRRALTKQQYRSLIARLAI